MQNIDIGKSNISKQIAEQLREAIVSGKFKIGDRLPTEDDLARRFQVSRPTVREALKRLAAQNLVRAKRGPAGGSFVIQPSYEELAESLSASATLLVGMGALSIEEIIVARRMLQSDCLRLAVKNANHESLRKIETALLIQKCAELSDQEFCQADVAFHRALVDATDNGMLRFVMYTVIEALVPLTNMVVTVVRQRSDIITFHEQLFNQLSKRQEQDLIKTFNALMDYLLEKFEQATVKSDRQT